MKFEEIIERHNGLIWKVVNKYGIDYLDKEDLYQECLMQIWDKYNEYNDDYKLTTYLYVICKNHLINLVKAENSQKSRNHLVNSEGIDIILANIRDYDFTNYVPDKPYTDKELDTLVTSEMVLDNLNDIKRYIIEQYLYMGRTQQSIANELGYSKNYISIIWLDFIDKVKERLEWEEE